MKALSWIAAIACVLGFAYAGLLWWNSKKPERQALQAEAQKIHATHLEEERKNTPPDDETLTIDSTTVPVFLKERRGREIENIWYTRCVKALWFRGSAGPYPLRKRCGYGNVWILDPNAPVMVANEKYMEATKIGFLYPKLGFLEKIKPFKITVQYKKR